MAHATLASESTIDALLEMSTSPHRMRGLEARAKPGWGVLAEEAPKPAAQQTSHGSATSSGSAARAPSRPTSSRTTSRRSRAAVPRSGGGRDGGAVAAGAGRRHAGGRGGRGGGGERGGRGAARRPRGGRSDGCGGVAESARKQAGAPPQARPRKADGRRRAAPALRRRRRGRRRQAGPQAELPVVGGRGRDAHARRRGGRRAAVDGNRPARARAHRQAVPPPLVQPDQPGHPPRRVHRAGMPRAPDHAPPRAPPHAPSPAHRRPLPHRHRHRRTLSSCEATPPSVPAGRRSPSCCPAARTTRSRTAGTARSRRRRRRRARCRATPLSSAASASPHRSRPTRRPSATERTRRRSAPLPGAPAHARPGCPAHMTFKPVRRAPSSLGRIQNKLLYDTRRSLDQTVVARQPVREEEGARVALRVAAVAVVEAVRMAFMNSASPPRGIPPSGPS